MNKNETLTLWLSIGLALFAVMLLYSYTQEKSTELTKKFGTQTTLIVSTRDINEMETLDESMLELVDIPLDFAQPGHFTTIEDAIGQVALAPIGQGEQVLNNKIIEPGPVTGLSLQITPEKRALTIPIDEMRGVARLIKPGDRVDIIVSLDLREQGGSKKYIKTLLEDVVILATGANIMNELPRLQEQNGDKNFIRNIRGSVDFSSITIEASPNEIRTLVYILSTSPGSLFLSLRHPSDRLKNNISEAITVEDIIRRKRSLASKNKAQPTRKVPDL